MAWVQFVTTTPGVFWRPQSCRGDARVARDSVENNAPTPLSREIKAHVRLSWHGFSLQLESERSALRAVRSDDAGRRHATTPRPFFATSANSFNDAPRGRFSPRSHWLTRLVVTLR